MNTLFLTAAESTLFQSLSTELKEGWSVENEKGGAEETPEELDLRHQMVSLTDGGFRTFIDALKEAKSPGDFDQAASKIRAEDLSPDVLAEMFFTLGTKVTSAFVEYLLTKIETDEDIEGLAGITQMRHMLYEVNSQNNP